MKTLPFLVAFAAVLLGSCTSAEPTTTSAPASTQITTPNSATSPQGQAAEVEFVFDGDSLDVKLNDGSTAEVRLIGINAPESDECFGDEARATLQDLLAAGSLTLVADEEESDQFGRLLRYAYVDGSNVNLAMVETGNALAIQTGHSQDDQFARSSDVAASDRLGMWAANACSSDDDLPNVSIVDYVFDPRGSDADNANGEWVAISNEGSAALDLGGWILRDESTQHRYRFADGFTLVGGNEVLVRSGCGTDTAAELYWCATDPVWSNGGDTIILQRREGTIVARERYAGNF